MAIALLLKNLISGAVLIGGQKPVEKLDIGEPGYPDKLVIYNGKIYVYNSLGQTLIDGGYISARAISANSIIAGKLSTAVKKFVHNLVWTAVDNNTASWSSGIIALADGTYLSVNSGNTGNLTEKNYIYYNGTLTLQKTQYYNIAIGGSNIPLAIVEPTADIDGKCLISAFISPGTTIDGDLILTGKIESSGGQTYFDLNNNFFKVSDVLRDRVIIGKMGSAYGIKVSLFGVDASSETDINKFALWAMSDDDTDNILIKEKIRGSVSVDGGGYGDREEVAHGLSYVPFCLVFVEESSGQYLKCYGMQIGGGGFHYEIDNTNLTLFNDSGSTKIFKYYIFYDQMT